MDITAESVVLTALKKTEDGDGLLLRFCEWAGKNGEAEIVLPEGAVSARLTNLLEEPYGSDLQLKNRKLVVPFHPFEIVSVRVNYPPTSR